MFVGLFFIILCISALLYEYIKAKSDEELPEPFESEQENDEDEKDKNNYKDYIEIDEYEEYEKKDNIQIKDKDTDD